MTGMRSVFGTLEFTIQLPRDVDWTFSPGDCSDVVAAPPSQYNHISIALICTDYSPVVFP